MDTAGQVHAVKAGLAEIVVTDGNHGIASVWVRVTATPGTGATGGACAPSIVFAMAGGSAGLAGVMFGMKYTVYPWMGNITIKAFIAAVVGGLGSLPGAVVGAFLLGITETLAAAFVSSAFRDLFSFALMILIIIVRPSGLMGVIAKE